MYTKVYLATSWNNPRFEEVKALLEANNFEVYDFKEASHSFRWYDIDPQALSWKLPEAIKALKSSTANTAYNADMTALQECDVIVMLEPCGKSAYFELAYALMNGTYAIAYLHQDHIGPIELMIKDVHIVSTDRELLEALH